MKLFVAVTNTEWFNQLSALKPDEVNFWKPSGASFRALSRGEPLLFKLHFPNYFIVGLGFFVSYSVLPASLAWNVFGEKNGAKSLYSLKERIRELREDDAGPDPEIGCRVLTNPEFFPRDQWIPCPASFDRNIVQGKSYSTDNAEGDWLWASVEQRIAAVGRYGSSVEVRSRLGQGAFRVLVTDAYHKKPVNRVTVAASVMPANNVTSPSSARAVSCLRNQLSAANPTTTTASPFQTAWYCSNGNPVAIS